MSMQFDRKKLEKIMSAGSALVAGIVASVLASTMFFGEKETTLKEVESRKHLLNIVQKLQNEQENVTKLNKLEMQVAQLIAETENAKKVKENTKVSASIEELREKYNKSDKRVSKLEETILDDPAKAVSLVLLKNEIETMKKTIEVQREFSKQEVDRLYTQTQWLMGTLIALALSIIPNPQTLLV